MKIEIELSEVERLRTALAYSEERVEKLEKQIRELDEDKLKEKAVSLSYRLFERYTQAIFNSLGFQIDHHRSMFSSDLTYQLGKDWWTREKDLEVTIGATVTEKFRSAFLHIGVVPKEQISEPEEFKL